MLYSFASYRMILTHRVKSIQTSVHTIGIPHKKKTTEPFGSVVLDCTFQVVPSCGLFSAQYTASFTESHTQGM